MHEPDRSSGSGRSTLLGCINALVPVTSGSIEIGFAREIADHVYFTERSVIIGHGPPRGRLVRPSEGRTRAFPIRYPQAAT